MKRIWLLCVWLLTCCGIAHSEAQTLQMGMRGDAVKTLQEELIDAGYLAREADGDYASATAKAVALFQEDHGMKVTGAADEPTQTAVIKETHGRVGGGVLYAEGNRGPKVMALQEKLSKEGYLSGKYDGVYGRDTTAAVKAYQKERRMPVTGVIDEMTWDILFEGESPQNVTSAETSEEPEEASLITTGLKRGSRGEAVETLQELLQHGAYLNSQIDGVYGGDTETAVKRFQKAEKLSVTGRIDEKTQKALHILEKENKMALRPQKLKKGDKGKQVVLLQNRLLLHGYDPGTVDGVYGENTVKAVEALQKEHSLPRTGMADMTVWKALNESPLFTGQYKKMLLMESTAYTPYDGSGSGKTSMGSYGGKGHVAVDPDVIPLGSIVYVEGYGYAVCDDIGGAIKGKRIDVGVETLRQATQWGRKQDVKVYWIR